MNAILGFFGSRWFLSFIGVALLGLLIWYFGQFLAAFVRQGFRPRVVQPLEDGVEDILDFRRAGEGAYFDALAARGTLGINLEGRGCKSLSAMAHFARVREGPNRFEQIVRERQG